MQIHLVIIAKRGNLTFKVHFFPTNLYNKYMESYTNQSPDDTAKKLQTDIKNGLTSQEVDSRLKQYGPNELKQAKGKNPLMLLFSQFTDVLVVILILASIASYFLGEGIDALMIVIIVIINAIIGFIQEYRVEKAIESLKKMVTSNQTIFRDGKLLQIPSAGLVPGDLVVLEEGQKITADIRLTEVINLQTIEAPLTGESTPVSKKIENIEGNLPLGDQKNMAFSGTIVSAGKGMGLVVSTGMNTQIGKIAHLVSSQQETETPMQIKLDKLGSLIGKIVLVIAVIVALEEVILSKGSILEAIISSIALAVAAIPEGLPAVVTISLALGTKRLLAHKALIRNLPAAETLGSTEVICTDKTGTLTEGVMNVRKIFMNQISLNIEQKDSSNKNPNNLTKLLEMGILSSNARKSNENFVGDPTEVALIKIALENGINQDDLLKKYNRITEIPFTSDRKMMSTISESEGKQLVTAKGAVEAILNICSQIEINGKVEKLTEEHKKQILTQNEELATQALRVLAFAYKTSTIKETVISNASEKSADSSPSVQNDIEKDLTFLGLQAMMDPPKEGVKEAIEICQKEAAIKVIMITGDHLITAQAIAREVGITGIAITGEELDKISEEDFKTRVGEIMIYARVNPEHKLRIVNALKANGLQVAMTGDGVNDAPALKAADIGIGMGITGTDVAKDSSDMILMDDHFGTIVNAVREGRGIFENIRKFVAYLLSANAMEVMIIFFSLLLGWPLPLMPIHLLWINLVTDGLPAVALGVDPARPNIMTSHPQEFKQQIVNLPFFKFLMVISVMVTIAVLSIIGVMKNDPLHEQTMAFTAVVLFEMIIIWAIRSQYRLPFFSNKYLIAAVSASLILHLGVLYLPIQIGSSTLQELFKVTYLSLTDWGIILGAGALLAGLWKIILPRFVESFNPEIKLNDEISTKEKN